MGAKETATNTYHTLQSNAESGYKVAKYKIYHITLQKAYDQGRLLYTDKKSGQRFNSGRQGANCPTTISEDVRGNNIQRFWENVKWRELNNSGTNVTRHKNIHPRLFYTWN